MKLRLLDYLTEIKEFNGAAISAKLQCTCGATSFGFLHTGKQTKGILAPLIVKKRGQLILRARCSYCREMIEVFNSKKDGANANNRGEAIEFVPFVPLKSMQDHFSVVIKYNYFPEKLKIGETYSNQFENCFIYILKDNGKEGKALIEE